MENRSRRDFLRFAGLGAAGLLVSGALGAAESTIRKKPNILFCLADDWAWPHASCLGDPIVKTPTFDRVVREGVLFQNAHCASPSCSPSRAAILTGQWPWRLENGANLRGFLSARFEVYPDQLERAGYHVGLMGKGYGPGGQADRKRNAAGPSFKSFDAFLAARPAGKPFCFWLGSHHPHRPYERGCGVQSGMDPAKVVVPPYLPDTPEVRSDICDYYYNTQVYDQQECAQALAAVERLGELEDTIVVMTGDNGWPFPRCKATNYDSGTHQALAIRWGARVKGGRRVDDFVSLSDLAPTFLEAAGETVPAGMTARSLLSILLSDKAGQVDPGRDHVLTCMETHVFCRELEDGRLGGYPRRTMVTKDFHFIRNFHPERWPAGDPKGFEVPGAAPFPVDQLLTDTHAAYADIDASPSKVVLVQRRDEAGVKPFAEAILGKRPARELYDLRKDPHEMVNVAGDPAYAETVKRLEEQLLAELLAAGDPRAKAGGVELDRLGGEVEGGAKKKKETRRGK